MQTFLEQHDAGESVLEVPEIDGGHAALKVELAVRVEGLVGLDFQLAQARRRRGAVLDRRLVCVGPWRSAASGVNTAGVAAAAVHLYESPSRL